jgi:hypothetical protein
MEVFGIAIAIPNSDIMRQGESAWQMAVAFAASAIRYNIRLRIIKLGDIPTSRAPHRP